MTCKCEICGKELKNLAGLNGHKKAIHKISPSKELNESKAAEKLIQKEMVTESKEIREVVTKKENEFVSVNENINSEFVTKKINPYRDLYPNEGEVINEWL